MDVLVSRYVARGGTLLRICTVKVVKFARTVVGVLESAKTDGRGALFVAGFALFFAPLSVGFGGTPTALLYRGGGGGHWHVAAEEVLHVFGVRTHVAYRSMICRSYCLSA